MSKSHPAHGWKNSARQRNRRKNNRIILAVASAVVLLLTYVCKEVLGGELKDWSDSIQAAQSDVNTERNESMISMQIMAQTEASELYRAKDVAASKDYSAIIMQDTLIARQGIANLNTDFESTSHLIDKLLFIDIYGDWARARNEQRAKVDEANKFVEETLAPSPKNDLGRMAMVKVALMKPLVVELTLTFLESSAMTATTKVKSAIDWVRRVLIRASYIFFLIGLCLGVYAAVLDVREPQQ
jgi:hypothetical protein